MIIKLLDTARVFFEIILLILMISLPFILWHHPKEVGIWYGKFQKYSLETFHKRN